MPAECRRCHYALEDLINNDVFECLDSGPDLTSRRCFSQDREGYNYEQDFFSIIKERYLDVAGRPAIDLSIAGDGGASEDDKGKGAGAYAYAGDA